MQKSLATFKNYAWRKGSHPDKHLAPIFGECVDQLQEKIGKPPKPSDVLEEARDSSSPIHPLFNWDDSDAAEKFRKLQASMYLSALVVKVDVMRGKKVEEIELPVRVSLNREANHGSGGREHIKDIINSREMRNRMVEMAADELLSIQRRYSYLKELHRVFYEVDRVIEKKVPQLAHKKGHGGV